MKTRLFFILLTTSLLSYGQLTDSTMKKEKTDRQWQNELSVEEYRVLRQCGTEPAFSGKYYKHKDKGTYHCAACGELLFSSETKFDSGSGWPSFYAPADKKNIKEVLDTRHGMTRTEIKCAHCGSHLGHVFPDGPKPSGMRFCVNSVSLEFEKDEVQPEE
ncbi:MAG: peptide-methionine (R)-S-oxide reductase MsrB [Bacteroidales bacterium]|nr:peptide-methionine (R)-S-oxide reductase MsrB [Bacteroidales bacterium]MCF6341537.1 peptide-methionine (R)-S-oxide reductase MsrB [Bacteroidales bacterium]